MGGYDPGNSGRGATRGFVNLSVFLDLLTLRSGLRRRFFHR